MLERVSDIQGKRMKGLISPNQTVVHLCSQMADLIVPLYWRAGPPPCGRNWFIWVSLSLSKTFDSTLERQGPFQSSRNSNLRVSLLHSLGVSSTMAAVSLHSHRCLPAVSFWYGRERRRQLLKSFGALSSLLPFWRKHRCSVYFPIENARRKKKKAASFLPFIIKPITL